MTNKADMGHESKCCGWRPLPYTTNIGFIHLNRKEKKSWILVSLKCLKT